MQKINFINGTTPAINATNLNKMQDNVEDVTGDQTNLTTTNKTNLVSAINEVNGNVGTLSNLTTTNKSSAVAAINEVNANSIKSNNSYTASNTDTYSCNFINQMGTYSSSEMVVGRYDNKPLYRRVYETTQEISGGAFTSISIAHGISNIDRIWIDTSATRLEQNIEGVYSCYPLPMVGYEGNTTDKVYAKVNKSDIIIYGQGWGTNWNKVVSVLYTKTTD